MSLSQDRGVRGAAMLEFAMSSVLIAAAILFVLDAGLVATTLSTLNHATATLTRDLSVDLGRAWRNGTVANAPWNGSCGNYVRSRGAAFLSNPTYSISDPAAPYYFGATLDNINAIVLDDADAPYAIIRMVGLTAPKCIFCKFFRNAVLTSESSILVEFDDDNCADY